MGRNLSVRSGEWHRRQDRRGGGESHEIGQHSPEKEEGPEGFPFGPCFYQVD